jgi:hypothetical protein
MRRPGIDEWDDLDRRGVLVTPGRCYREHSHANPFTNRLANGFESDQATRNLKRRPARAAWSSI